MRIDSLVSKLKLKDEWAVLQTNPNALLFETFLLEIIKHLQSKRLILLDFDQEEILAYYPDSLKPITQIFKKVSPLYGLESKNKIVKELCYEASLSLEKKMERAARAWGWKSLDLVLECMEGRESSNKNLYPAPKNLEQTLSTLDHFLAKESLARCLLSESRFIRERKLALKNKRKK